MDKPKKQATKKVEPKKAGRKKVASTKVEPKKAAVKSINVRPVGKATAAEIAAKLVERYPDADCELDYETDFQLLIAVIMSAQSTDVTINKVTPKLFKDYGTPQKLAEADIEKIKRIIMPTGFFNAKAKNIQDCAQMIVTKYGGKVPTTREELITLPGVGRKTANVVLGVAHNIPGWTVDTHVQRLSKRLGFTRESDPYKIELDLEELFPPKKFDSTQLSITLIWHGRRCCFARKPDCINCPVNQLCPSSEVV
ncbi:MAG: endonuclease III [Cyanobacteria bacterium REEB67]|nr:endonuclease III [Cyanobacteria bacterium REEB67]